MTESDQTKKIHKRSFFKKLLVRTELRTAFKTGLAASLSWMAGIAFSKFSDRPDTLVSGLWCVLAAIVVMQAHLEGTYKAAWARFLGVLIGSIAGAFFMTYLGDDPLSLGISVFLTIVICALINIKDSFRIASMSTAVIIIMGSIHPTDPWMFSLFRFLDSCIGIMISIFIAYTIWPEKAVVNLRHSVAETLDATGRYYTLAINLEPESELYVQTSDALFVDIQNHLEENRTYLGEAKVELLNREFLDDDWTSITSQLENIFESLVSLRNIHKHNLSQIFDDSLDKHVSIVIEKTQVAFQNMEKMISFESPLTPLNGLDAAINNLNEDLLRFRNTRTTRKFNLEDVESFFVFFYSLRNVAESVKKMEHSIQDLQS